MSKVIAITNQKGGVAKTTTTLHMGIGLANCGHKVLLIDGDPQGSLSYAMGITDPDGLEYSLYNIMKDTADMRPVEPHKGIMQYNENVDFVPNHIAGCGLDNEIVNAFNREFLLKKWLEPIKAEYDYVLIDGSPSLGQMTKNSLAAADEVIIPTKPDHISFGGFQLLMNTVEMVRDGLNHDLKVAGVLMTIVQTNTNYSKGVIEMIHENLGTRLNVFDTVIPATIKVGESYAMGTTLFETDPKNHATVAYGKFIKEFIKNERNADKSQNKKNKDREER